MEEIEMPVVGIEHAVPDFDGWKQAFDSDPADRKGSGVRRDQVYQQADDPRFVMIDLEFDDMDRAEAFLRVMERIWGGPGKAVMLGPRARVVRRVEDREP